MARLHQWIAFATVGLVATGCVSTKEHQQVKLERDQALQQLEHTQAAMAEAQRDIVAYQRQLAFIEELDGQLTAVSWENYALQQQLDALNAKYTEAIDLVHATGAQLPGALVEQLSAFADAHKDVLAFDADRRMIQFKSDLTFGLGSVDLNPQAKQVLAELAKILNDQSVQPYELMIAGHTDNVPVARASTIKAGHKDNWYLSAHRAIAVGQELSKHKVGSDRMAMVGYADQRPVATNSTKEGRMQNRRVEVLILPSTVKVAQPDNSWTADATAQTDTGPLLNK